MRGRRALLVASVILAGVAGCRIAPVQPTWVEMHGAAEVHAIGACPKGVLGIGLSGMGYVSPGPWGVPWPEHVHEQGRHLVGSNTAEYLLHQDGSVRRIVGGVVTAMAGSDTWRADWLAASEDDVLFVLARGRAHRVVGEQLVALACNDPARSLAATATAAYVLGADGVLRVARGSRCEVVPTPEPVNWNVAAHTSSLAVVSENGVGYLDRGKGKGWQRLPEPAIFRGGGFGGEKMMTIALGPWSVWGLSQNRHVFLLSDPT